MRLAIGANGCGKSTFMKILGGELEPGAREGLAHRADLALTRQCNVDTVIT